MLESLCNLVCKLRQVFKVVLWPPSLISDIQVALKQRLQVSFADIEFILSLKTEVSVYRKFIGNFMVRMNFRPPRLHRQILNQSDRILCPLKCRGDRWNYHFVYYIQADISLESKLPRSRRLLCVGFIRQYTRASVTQGGTLTTILTFLWLMAYHVAHYVYIDEHCVRHWSISWD